MGQWSRGGVHGQKNSQVDIWVNYLGEAVMEPRFLTRFFSSPPAVFPSFLTLHFLTLTLIFVSLPSTPHLQSTVVSGSLPSTWPCAGGCVGWPSCCSVSPAACWPSAFPTRTETRRCSWHRWRETPSSWSSSRSKTSGPKGSLTTPKSPAGPGRTGRGFKAGHCQSYFD